MDWEMLGSPVIEESSSSVWGEVNLCGGHHRLAMLMRHDKRGTGYWKGVGGTFLWSESTDK